jgi:hypothetical protein
VLVVDDVRVERDTDRHDDAGDAGQGEGQPPLGAEEAEDAPEDGALDEELEHGSAEQR